MQYNLSSHAPDAAHPVYIRTQPFGFLFLSADTTRYLPILPMVSSLIRNTSVPSLGMALVQGTKLVHTRDTYVYVFRSRLDCRSTGRQELIATRMQSSKKAVAILGFFFPRPACFCFFSRSLKSLLSSSPPPSSVNRYTIRHATTA